MSPEEYGRFAHKQEIDIDNLFFDKESGDFYIPVYLTPEEYPNYCKDKVLPSRYLVTKLIKNYILVTIE